jgi:hypothetical protein
MHGTNMLVRFRGASQEQISGLDGSFRGAAPRLRRPFTIIDSQSDEREVKSYVARGKLYQIVTERGEKRRLPTHFDRLTLACYYSRPHDVSFHPLSVLGACCFE